MFKFVLTTCWCALSLFAFSNNFYLANQHSYEIAALQQKMTNNQVILAYQTDINELLLDWVLIKKSHQEILKIPLPLDFNDRVQAFYQQLRDFSIVQKSKRARFIKDSHYFYQLLLLPFKKHFQNNEQLLIIGKGMLQYLPFEVLLSQPNDLPFEQLDFLIKNHSVSYYFQPDDFLNSAKQQTSNFNQQFLGFAPVFQNKNEQTDQGIASRSTTSEQVPPLPHSEIEVKNIAQIVPASSKLFLHEKAQKSILQQQIQGNFSFIHIATHSYADFQNAANAGILCASGDKDINYEILYTKDIEKLRIQADLVVLSSCESGVGQFNSEGVHGIHRSFYRAGAKNVVFSLWKVNDKICQRFMTVFYTQIVRGATYADALRLAKLDLLHHSETASPNIWSAFLMIGR